MDEHDARGSCLVCGKALSLTPRTCLRCDTPHHAECWNYNGGCAVFGCKPRPVKSAAAPRAVPFYRIPLSESGETLLDIWSMVGWKFVAPTVVTLLALAVAILRHIV